MDAPRRFARTTRSTDVVASTERFRSPPPKQRDDDVPDEIKRPIAKAGYRVGTLYRNYTPVDSWDDGEVLFLGHESGQYKAPDRPLTAYLSHAKDGIAIVSEGW
jgi:hypothetical protein